MAQIHVHTGPMASGKTSKMLHNLHKYSNVTRERVLLINFRGDSRANDSETGVSTHMYGDSSAKVPLGKYVDAHKVYRLSDLDHLNIFDNYNMIGIDEAQFYPDLKDFIVNNLHKNCIFHIAGLSYDSDNNEFGELLKIQQFCTTFEKMSAICSECNPRSMTPAGFTYCEQLKESVVTIGGLDIYKPLCLRHYLEKNPNM